MANNTTDLAIARLSRKHDLYTMKEYSFTNFYFFIDLAENVYNY